MRFLNDVRARIAAKIFVSLLLSVCSAAQATAADLDLSAYKGKVVYLDFWASWCGPCRQSFSWMNGIEDSYGHDGLVVIAVNVDHDRSLAQAFLQQNPADFKILYDPEGSLAEQYNVEAMPTSILIGRDGKVAYVHSGFFPGKQREYLAHVYDLLNRKPS